MIGIYKITNKCNGLSYIGRSKDIDKRFKRHKYLANSGSNSLLHIDIRKYGFNNFELSILKEVNSINECISLETYYIDLYNTIAPNGYNKSRGPGCLSMNFKMTYKDKDSWKKHLSESHKGKPSSMKGKHHTNETKEKLSNIFKGKPNIKNKGINNGMYGKTPWNKGKHNIYSDETKRKMKEHTDYKASGKKISEALKGRHWYKDPITNKRIWY